MRPVTVEEAAGLLADAAAAGRRVRIGEDLSTEGLDRVLEHEAGDLTCTVEAGIRLSALQETLSAAGQRLSLDPPGDPTSTCARALTRSQWSWTSQGSRTMRSVLRRMVSASRFANSLSGVSTHCALVTY